MRSGEVPEWPKGSDCKSDGLCLRRFESSPLHQFTTVLGGAGIAQLVEREPSKLGVAGSSPVSRSSFVVQVAYGQSNDDDAHVAQPVEHFLGKEEVTGS